MTQLYRIITKQEPTMYFIGVTTGKSSIMKIFPVWVRELGHPNVVIEGVDRALHDNAEAYRQTVAQIKYDPNSLGALVTTHKLDLLEASRDMFDYLDPYAQICDEVSCISKQVGKLEGHAKDPLTAGLSIDAILGAHYFAQNGGEVLCFGAGGSAAAIALHFISRERSGDRPQRLLVVNRSQGRLHELEKMVKAQQTDIAFEYICNEDLERNDAIMSTLPEGSLVINATGMGKDRPGSPVTAQGIFPRNGIAWELNYRGELDFLHQAYAQHESRHVQVEDGWLYFLHGWTQVIAQVLHLEMKDDRFNRLATLAEEIRPSRQLTSSKQA